MKRVRSLAQRNRWTIRRKEFNSTATRTFSFSSSSHYQPLRPFEIEQYDGWHVPTVAPGLSDSDCQPLTMKELLSVASPECREQWDELSLGYPPRVQGDMELRQEIVRQLYPVHGSWDRINCMAPQEGIFCGLQALLGPGDAVIVAAPCYQSLNEVPRSMGCQIQHWHPQVEVVDGISLFRFNPDTLERLLESQRYQTKALVVNFPHNPTGALPTLSEWDEIVELCRRHGVYLFCDEMYRGLEQPGVDCLPPAIEAYERGISLGGLSKAYGLAGLRLGWIAARDDAFLKRVQQIKDYTTICPSTPSQVLGRMALCNHAALVRRCQGIVHEMRDVVYHFCQKHSDKLEWVEPRSGSMIFPRLLLQGRGGGAREYCDRLLKEAGIMLLPSSLFDYGDGHAKDDSRVRISLGRTTIQKSLQVWETYGV